MHKSLLIGLVESRKSTRDMSTALGCSKSTIRYWLKKHGLKTRGWGIVGRLSKQELNDAVSRVTTYAECLRQFSLPASGGSFQILKRRVRELGISTAHFKQKRGTFSGLSTEKFVALLTENSKLTQNRLRKYILRFGLLPHICGECGQHPLWNRKLLVLQLDHKNGVKSDCRIENLRWLCPNCHTQTETFGRRNGAASVMA